MGFMVGMEHMSKKAPAICGGWCHAVLGRSCTTLVWKLGGSLASVMPT